jgi:hypothetical protein
MLTLALTLTGTLSFTLAPRQGKDCLNCWIHCLDSSDCQDSWVPQISACAYL